MIASWENAWQEFVPFLEFPVELRKIVYTTNAIAVRHRGHFPNEQAALKVLYLVATTRRQNREHDRTNPQLEANPQRPNNPLRRQTHHHPVETTPQ
jgi:transposase-like protein